MLKVKNTQIIFFLIVTTNVIKHLTLKYE